MPCVIDTPEQYRQALERLNALTDAGEKTETNPELAELEAAIARYVGKPDEPATRKGRPKQVRP